MVEQTLVLIKPDGVMKGVTEAIIQRYLDEGLSVVKRRNLTMKAPLAKHFYHEHEGKFYFEGLVLAMISGPLVAVLLRGKNAIEVVRKLNGATDPAKAESGTIRHDFRSAGGPFNTVHGSDSPEAYRYESVLIFG